MPILADATKAATTRYSTGARDWGAVTVHFVAPVVVGVAVWAFQVHLPDVGALFAGVGLLTGTLMGLFFHVSAWRQRISESDVPSPPRVARLVDETAALVLYAALIGLFLAGLVVAAAASVGPADPTIPDGVGQVHDAWTIAVLVVGGHLISSLLQVFRRVYAVYTDINGVRRNRPVDSSSST